MVVQQGTIATSPSGDTRSRFWRQPAQVNKFTAAAFFVFSLVAYTNIADQALAQQITLPASADPARIEIPEIDDDDDEGFELSFSVSVAEGCTPPVGSEDEEIDFEGLTLTGNTVMEATDLEPIWADFVGQTITMTDLYSICEKVSQEYQRGGWMLSWASFPVQDVEDGIFTLRVIEGFISQIVVEPKENPDGEEGTTLRTQETLEKLLAPLKHFKPSRIDITERYLKLADDLAGVTISSVMRPDDSVEGGTRMTVQVIEKPYSLTYLTNNRGSKTAGPWTHTLVAGLNSPFGLGESITTTLVGASRLSEQRLISLAGELPIGTDGSKLHAGGSYSVSNPGFNLDSLDITSISKSIDGGISHQFVKVSDESLEVDISAKYSHSQSELGTGVDLTDEKTIRATVKLDYFNNGFLGGTNLAAITYTQPIHFDGLTSDPDTDLVSRGDANTWAPKINLDATHIRALGGFWTLQSVASIQLATHPLFSGDEFGVGGQSFGRAYVASEITGDYGFALSGEVQANLPIEQWLPADLPDEWKLLSNLQGYGFLDGGHTWNYDDDTGTGSQKLMSAGLGLRTTHPGGVSLNAELAQPFLKGIATHYDEKPLRWFVGVTVSW